MKVSQKKFVRRTSTGRMSLKQKFRKSQKTPPIVFTWTVTRPKAEAEFFKKMSEIYEEKKQTLLPEGGFKKGELCLFAALKRRPCLPVSADGLIHISLEMPLKLDENDV